MNETETSQNRTSVVAIFKDWKKYIFEFLMLFLAVYLGFVAENIREDFAERQYTQELVRSFYEELRNDSVAVAARVEGRLKKERAIEYMVNFFRDSSLTVSSKPLAVNFVWALAARSPIIFTPRTIVLEQIKSTGALRYFKSEELRKLIGDLSVAIDYILVRQEYESSIFYTYIEPVMTTHMDFSFQFKLFQGESIFERLAEYESSAEYIPFQLSQPEKVDRLKIMNVLSYYHTNGLKSTRLIPFKNYIEVNAGVLRQLRKAYDVK